MTSVYTCIVLASKAPVAVGSVEDLTVEQTGHVTYPPPIIKHEIQLYSSIIFFVILLILLLFIIDKSKNFQLFSFKVNTHIKDNLGLTLTQDHLQEFEILYKIQDTAECINLKLVIDLLSEKNHPNKVTIEMLISLSFCLQIF